MALERPTSNLINLIPSESPSTKVRPEGDPPSACYYCHEAFPERIVGTRWAEVCLTCKREHQHRLVDFPIRYQRISLDSCNVHEGNKNALAAAKKWSVEGNHNLWFYGNPGSGKTHIASAAFWDGPIGTVQFVNVAEMLLNFQSSVKDHDELQMIKRYFKPFTLFDDVGAHRISAFGLEMFGLLLDKFYSNNIYPLIFTSNLSPKQILETMGERIASRLRGLSEPIKVEGDDLRLKEHPDLIKRVTTPKRENA